MFNNTVPIHAPFNCIYPGPHIDDSGRLDERVWFSLPISLDEKNSSITYLVFPYGGEDEEVKEIIIEVPGSWTD